MPWTSDAPLTGGCLVDAGEYALEGAAANTQRAYRSDCADFMEWCVAHHVSAMPATAPTLAAYIADLATPRDAGGRGHRASTVRRRLAAISRVHETAGLESPANDPSVRSVMAGILREHGSAPRGKLPLRVHHLRLMIRQIPSNAVGVRNKALLLFGFAGAFRRSELVAIDRSHLDFVREGVRVVVRNPRNGAAEVVAIPYGRHLETCPVRAVLAWLELLPIGDGPVFRPFDRWGHIRPTRLTDDWVAKVVKQYVRSIGMNPDHFAGHSLRTGLAVAAAAAGASERSIMNQTRYRSPKIVQHYIRNADIPPSANALRFTGL